MDELYTQEELNKQNEIRSLAEKTLHLAADRIVVHMRFLDLAVAALKREARFGMGGACTDGSKLYYDPIWLLRRYEKEPAFVLRLYLHILFHCIFFHSYQYGRLDREDWDLAADLATEHAVLELELGQSALERDDRLREMFAWLRSEMSKTAPFTAEYIYRYLHNMPPSKERRQLLVELSHFDEHTSWNPKEELTIGEEQFKKIAERVKADLKSFSKNKTGGEALSESLAEATKQRYDYRDILSRFATMHENIGINEDEFDYVYYTYGLEKYHNMPLIEPLEYKEEKKVREFVIVIDTSASVKGALVQSFLKKTYGILMQTENFFSKVNIHILMSDREVQEDVKITCEADFQTFLKNGKLTGFGATDFRPAFSYVGEMIAKREFENLKGLIYFTDGYGIYPERMPEFDTIFAFLSHDEHRPKVPVWAIEVVLEEEELERT
ncbi:MAG: VWA-like domain-containing protein [Lachnospiraceae bacterium]|nr:VWA-like domain-containing protein [Lachnospiraceae bacterium]